MRIITQKEAAEAHCPTSCDECSYPCDALIEVGEELARGSATAWICYGCLVKAVKTMGAHFDKQKKVKK